MLFEHAVGYALLALKEVEEISLLLPQVSECAGRPGACAEGPAGEQARPSMHRALPRGRAARAAEERACIASTVICCIC